MMCVLRSCDWHGSRYWGSRVAGSVGKIALVVWDGVTVRVVFEEAASVAISCGRVAGTVEAWRTQAPAKQPMIRPIEIEEITLPGIIFSIFPAAGSSAF